MQKLLKLLAIGLVGLLLAGYEHWLIYVGLGAIVLIFGAFLMKFDMSNSNEGEASLMGSFGSLILIVIALALLITGIIAYPRPSRYGGMKKHFQTSTF